MGGFVRKGILSAFILLGSLTPYNCSSPPQLKTSIPHDGFSSAKTVFSENVLKNLKYFYVGKFIEYPLCLFGKEKDGTYYVEDLGFPNIGFANQIMTNFNADTCREREDYLGLIHNHVMAAGEGCGPSEGDLERFRNDTSAVIESIVCDVKYVPRPGFSSIAIKTIDRSALEIVASKNYNTPTNN